MGEEIFALTVLGWRERISRQSADAELSESQYLAIDALVQAQKSLTVGEIQRNIKVLPAQMSRIIRSLEKDYEKPLIRCELNQNDKRKIDVRLTNEGQQIYDKFRQARLSKAVDILRGLAEQDRKDFIRVCSKIRELMKASANRGADSEN